MSEPASHSNFVSHTLKLLKDRFFVHNQIPTWDKLSPSNVPETEVPENFPCYLCVTYGTKVLECWTFALTSSSNITSTDEINKRKRKALVIMRSIYCFSKLLPLFQYFKNNIGLDTEDIHIDFKTEKQVNRDSFERFFQFDPLPLDDREIEVEVSYSETVQPIDKLPNVDVEELLFVTNNQYEIVNNCALRQTVETKIQSKPKKHAELASYFAQKQSRINNNPESFLFISAPAINVPIEEMYIFPELKDLLGAVEFAAASDLIKNRLPPTSDFIDQLVKNN